MILTIRLGNTFCDLHPEPSVTFGGARFHPVTRAINGEKELIGFVSAREFMKLRAALTAETERPTLREIEEMTHA